MKFEGMTDEQKAQAMDAFMRKKGGNPSPTPPPQSGVNINQITYDSNKRGYIIPYIMSAVFGWSGLHLLYLNAKRTAAWRFMLIPFSLVANMMGIPDYGTALLTILVIWWLTDLITLPFYVNSYNKKLARKYEAMY